MQIIIQRTSGEEPIFVDATVTELHTDSSLAATHAVEGKRDITDHLQPQAAVLSADIFITNSPVETPTSHTPAGFRITEVPRTLARQQTRLREFTTPLFRVREVYAALLRAMDEGVLCTVITSLRLYSDMAITLVDAPRQAPTGDGITLTVNFQQIFLAATKTDRITLAPRNRASTDKGSTPGSEPERAEAERIKGSSDLLTALTGYTP